MSLFNRRNGGGDAEPQQSPVRVRQPVAQLPPPPRKEYQDEAGMVWRCSRCGSMGTSHDSARRHIWRGDCLREHIREYVPREVYQEAHEEENRAKASQLAVSGIWIVVKMPDRTEEGSIAASYKSRILHADNGLEAIKGWYSEQIAKLIPSSTEADREEANGRYVAIDFFTGIRCEALVTSDWRANVEVAEGSHV